MIKENERIVKYYRINGILVCANCHTPLKDEKEAQNHQCTIKKGVIGGRSENDNTVRLYEDEYFTGGW